MINTDNCWLYAGHISVNGYGRIWINDKYIPVHRLMYELETGKEVSKDLHVDHLCRTRACINPAHLEPVTPRENVLRGVGPAAKYAKRDACKHGHVFDEKNTRMHGNIRRCRMCVKLSVIRHRVKQAALQD